MKTKLLTNAAWLAGVLATGFALLGGIFLFYSGSRVKQALEHASFDWSFDLRVTSPQDLDESGVMIIYLDQASHRQLNQPFNQAWDRGLHAQLIDRLTRDGARAVIFDVLFTDPGRDPEADRALETALRKNGRVLLASDLARFEPAIRNARDFLAADTITWPHEPFAAAAAATGLARLRPDPDLTIRRHFHGIAGVDEPSLAWAAASFLGAPAVRDSAKRFHERWMNYYGAPFSVPSVSYARALDEELIRPGFFRDKIVFVGAGQPIAGFFQERRDEFRTPHSRLHPELPFIPAVEIQATTLLNLLRQDWLVRLPPAFEWLILLTIAVVAGFGFSRMHPLLATAFALGATGATALLAMYLFKQHQIWFPWLSIVLGQIPSAWLVCMIAKSIEWLFQRRRFEQQTRRAALQISEQAALLDKAHDAIIVQTVEGRITFWNQGAERLYGWKRDEVIGQELAPILFHDGSLPPESREKLLLRSEWNGELQHRTKSGAKVIVESRWTLVDHQDTTRSVLMINTDVTEKKKIESQLLRAQRMESIGTLAGGIAHDLNNVLTPIVMSVDLLKPYHAEGHPNSEVLKIVETSARRGADLVKQVLTFARGHEGQRANLRLGPMVKEMEKIARETFPKSIEVRTCLATDLRPISADATQIHQVLLNLFVNARDAMPNGGRILVEARNVVLDGRAMPLPAHVEPGPFVLMTVSDTGSGIPPEILERIFEPFFTTKDVGKGTGLGLSTVMSIVKGHGGFIEVHSQPGAGTRFEIYLPALMETESTNAKDAPRLMPCGGETILILDDESAIRSTVSTALLNAGYRVLTAASGPEAISLCLAHFDRIKVALIDLMMPGMDGFTAVEALREIKPDLRIITMSGALQGEKLKQQLAVSNTTFLSKPFAFDALLATLQSELRISSLSRGAAPLYHLPDGCEPFGFSVRDPLFPRERNPAEEAPANQIF
ncbi:MAG: CHASE2 domain-containing protein [Verrucomicrobiota bacterium]